MTQAWLIDELSNDPNKYEAAQANGAFLINTILDQSHCDGVDFSGVIFLTDSMLSSQPASAQGATMNRTVFTDANVISVNFRGTQFAGGQFSNTILVCSQFQSTQITPTTDGVGSVPSMSEADIRGTLFADQTHGGITNAANMDGLDMDNATCSTVAGNYVAKLTDYYGKPVLVFEAYPATLLGTTTSATTCPNGSAGPCSLG